MSATRRAAEPEPEISDDLPPLEPDEDDTSPPGDDLAAFLERFPDDDDPHDDGPASDLDVGIELSGDEAEGDLEAEPLNLDLRELISGTESTGEDEGDDVGPDRFDPTVGLDPEPADFSGDDADGTDDAVDVSLGSALPPLDADEDGEIEADFVSSDFTAADERPLPRAARPWLEIQPSIRGEAVNALCAADGHALAGSGDLLWIQSGSESPLRLAAGDSRLVSVALVGPARESALCATASGRLLRRARIGPVTVLTQFREAAGLQPGEPIALELCQPGSARPSSVLLRLGNGKLLASDDCGTTFRTVELHGRVIALSSTSSPAVALVATRSGIALCRIEANGAHSAGLLAQPARAVASGERPLLAAWESWVAIADSERGTVLSRDGGRTFAIVPGCVGACALAAGIVGGKASVWTGVYRETEDVTDLVQIDAETLEAAVIARVEPGQGPGNLDPSETVEQAKISGLAWDPASERLWAAGTFGLVRLAPPG